LIRLAGVVLVCLAVPGAVAAAAPPQAGLAVSADPVLRPAFQTGVHDYVTRCRRSAGVRLSIAASEGTTVSVDGAPPRSGAFEVHVPIAAGQATSITARTDGRTASYHVRCLPARFPEWTAERTGPTQAQWYLLNPQSAWVVLFDARGVPVWWTHTKGKGFNPTLLAGGHLAWYPIPPHAKFGVWPARKYEEHRLDGSLVRRVGTVGVPTDLHEIQQLPNRHFLLDAYRPRTGVDLRRHGGPRDAKVYDAEIQEVTPSGRLVWRWSSHGHVGLGETRRHWSRLIGDQRKAPPSERGYDAVHVNSIAPDGDGIVISCRHTDALYRIDRETGRIDWKLGGTHTKRSLKIAGDPDHAGAELGAQHDARVLPDGTVTVYDNGSFFEDRPPRLLRFRIDARARTARLIEELSDPDVASSGWQGGTRRLPGGNWATSWASSSNVSEMTPAGARVFHMTFPGRVSYRVVPIPYGQLPARRLRDAMDRMHPRGG
jgi:Arylsulfotransferase (ASST)